jgi:hypothetical protein
LSGNQARQINQAPFAEVTQGSDIVRRISAPDGVFVGLHRRHLRLDVATS